MQIDQTYAWTETHSIFSTCMDHLSQGIVGGCTLYTGLALCRYFKWIEVASLSFLPYLAGGLTYASVYVTIDLTYHIGCKIVGPKEESHSSSLRTRCWQIIDKVEQSGALIDQTIIRLASFILSDRQHIEYVAYSFRPAIKRLILREISLIGAMFATIKVGGYVPLFMSYVVKPANHAMKVSLFAGAWLNEKNELESRQQQKEIANKEVDQWLETQGQDSINLSIVKNSLTPLHLELLLEKCPQLKTICLDVSQLSSIKGFRSFIRKDTEVILTPFPVQLPPLSNLMPSIIGSYPWIYHNLFDRKRQLRTTESYISKNDLQDSLNFIFTGKCPLYKLNELAYLMLSRRSLVDQSDADNIILRCADGSSIKAHQAILDLKCSNFTTAPVERATALQVLHFIYDGQVDDAVFDNVDAFIALCQTWGVKNFEEHLEKSLINYYLKYKGDSISFVQHLEKFKNHIDIKTPFSNLYKLMQ